MQEIYKEKYKVAMQSNNPKDLKDVITDWGDVCIKYGRPYTWIPS